MSKLIEELKNEHAIILEELNRVNELGINSREAYDKLLYIKATLLAHLEKENDRLYPGLRKAAENNKKLKLTLDTFAKDIEQVSREVLIFFDKYFESDSKLELAKGFGNVLAALDLRITKEEQILFKECENLASAKKLLD